MITGSTYSFLDVSGTIAGPSLMASFGNSAGAAEEGITIEMVGDKNTMTVGADGFWMHSLHAGNGATVTLRLLKTSPTNALLMSAYNSQRITSAFWGKNTITIVQQVSNDDIVCAGCAFVRAPNMEYALEGGTVTWAFHAGRVDGLLGVYV